MKIDEPWECRPLLRRETEAKHRRGEGETPVTRATAFVHEAAEGKNYHRLRCSGKVTRKKKKKKRKAGEITPS